MCDDVFEAVAESMFASPDKVEFSIVKNIEGDAEIMGMDLLRQVVEIVEREIDTYALDEDIDGVKDRLARWFFSRYSAEV